ncbi:MAG: isocitrate/isopropylmalate family dehydrogenase [Marinobacter sp.]|jgi:3-isopropylmalate dehydrogenase
MKEHYDIGVLNGDDIGLEIVPEAVRAMRAAIYKTGLAVNWVDIPIGRPAYDSLGTTMPADTLELLGALDGWVLGPIGHREYPKDDPKAINPHPILRKHFELHSNTRPARALKGMPAIHPQADLVIIRENTEGFQPDRNVVAGCGEFRPTHDTTISVRVITRKNSRAVAITAFELARQRNNKVTAVHKDTVFKLGCGMFAEECRKVASEYPDVEYNECIVDTFAMRVVMRPEDFDVVVTTNMFGDILSDLTAGLVGGLGLAPGLSSGDNYAMAQATHGSAPDISGKQIANPFAMIISGAMLLEWMGLRHGDERLLKAADLMRRSMFAVYEEDQVMTPDMGGNASTKTVGKAVAARIQAA